MCGHVQSHTYNIQIWIQTDVYVYIDMMYMYIQIYRNRHVDSRDISNFLLYAYFKQLEILFQLCKLYPNVYTTMYKIDN